MNHYFTKNEGRMPVISMMGSSLTIIGVITWKISNGFLKKINSLHMQE